MKTPTLTLSMIVKNEEKYLEGCLDSVKNVVDEIVIVDTGSTDKTLEIAEKFNAKIFHFDWIDDFSAARNFALSKSNGDWILYLDADERLNPASIEELKSVISTNNYTGVNCIITNLDDYSGNVKKMSYIRLFSKKEGIKFYGKAHEQINASLLQNNYKIIESNIEIIHEGYNLPRLKLKEKATRNLPLLLEEYKLSKDSYYAYQLGNTYQLLDNETEAVKFYEIALKDKRLKNEYKVIALLNLADSSRRKGDLLKAKEYIGLGITYDKTNVILNLVASQIYSGLNLTKEAVNFCKTALIENSNYSKNSNRSKVLTIQVKDEKIIYQGILLTFSSGDKHNLEYFLNKFKILKNKTEEAELIKLLINDSLTHEYVETLMKLINKDNMECYLALINNSKNTNIKLDILTSIYDSFKNKTRYLVTFGSALVEANFLEEGARILEESLDKEDKDPAAVFYLASIYLRLKKIIKLNTLVAKAEKLFSSNKLVMEKIKLLKSKLHPFLNEPISAN